MLVTQRWPPSVSKVRELLILLRLWRYELCEWCTLETMWSFVIVHDSWLSSSPCKLSRGTQAKVAGQTGVICLPGLIRNHSSFACTCTYMLVLFSVSFSFFICVQILKEWNPFWSPKFWITDYSEAEMLAVQDVFATCKICNFCATFIVSSAGGDGLKTVGMA